MYSYPRISAEIFLKSKEAEELGDRKYEVLIERYPYHLHLVPMEKRTLEFYTKACEKSVSNLQFVPDEFFTQEFCLSQLKRVPEAMEFIPDEFLTSEACKDAFNKSMRCFKWIPDEHKTKEMAMRWFIYLDEYGSNLYGSIPKNLIDLEFFTMLICNDFNGMIWHNIELIQKFITPKLFTKALVKTEAYHFGFQERNYIIDNLGEDFYNSLFTEKYRCKIINRLPSYALEIIPGHMITESDILTLIDSSDSIVYTYFDTHIIHYLHSEKICDYVLELGYRRGWHYIYENYSGYINAEKYESILTKNIKIIDKVYEYNHMFLTSDMLFRIVKSSPKNVKYLNYQILNDYYSLELGLCLVYFNDKLKLHTLLNRDVREQINFLLERKFATPYVLMAYRLGIISEFSCMKMIPLHEKFIQDLNSLVEIYSAHPVRFFNELAHTFTNDLTNDREFNLTMHKHIVETGETFTLRDALQNFKK